jgi:hypothetical protein
MGKKGVRTAFLLAAFFFPLSLPPAHAAWKVFLFGGQSNMEGKGSITNGAVLPYMKIFPPSFRYFNRTVGEMDSFNSSAYFGPELGFTHHITNVMKGSNILLIKYAIGSTAMPYWLTPTNYKSMLHFITNTLKSIPGQKDLMAMLWMQGESDQFTGSYASAYEANLKSFITLMRDSFQQHDLPFLIGIADSPDIYSPCCIDTVKHAQSNVAKTVPNTKIVQTFGLNRRVSYSDDIHYDAIGQLELGRRFSTNFHIFHTNWKLQILNSSSSNVSLTNNAIRPFKVTCHVTNPVAAVTAVTCHLSAFNLGKSALSNKGNGVFSSTFQVPSGLPAGARNISLVAFDSRSNVRASKITVTIVDRTAPNPGPVLQNPVMLTAGKCQLTWLPATDETGLAAYRYYWGLSSTTFSSSNITADSHAIISNLVPGTTNYFRVKAFDLSGNFSVSSTKSAVIPPDLPPSISYSHSSLFTNRPFILHLSVDEDFGYWSTNGRSGPYIQFPSSSGADILISHSMEIFFHGIDSGGKASQTNSLVFILRDNPAGLAEVRKNLVLGKEGDRHCIIRVDLDKPDQEADVKIYNSSGFLVRHFDKSFFRESVNHVEWDLRNGQGQPVASGTYLVVIQLPGKRTLKKVMIVR